MSLQVLLCDGRLRRAACACARQASKTTPRWRRYYSVIERGWQVSLAALKRYVENA